MLRMMEKYADNLEELVEEKTHQYMEEKKKADLLLYSMMPELVVQFFVVYVLKLHDIFITLQFMEIYKCSHLSRGVPRMFSE